LLVQLIFFLIQTFHAADNGIRQEKGDGNDYRAAENADENNSVSSVTLFQFVSAGQTISTSDSF
jgi:hypothetical protein